MTTYIMSTTVIPGGAWGNWRMEPVTPAQVAIALFPEGGRGWTSAVGHESTAAIISDLIGQNVPANRITVEPVPGDVFYCFRLLSRPPEGAILDRATLERIGFEWARMHYLG